MNKLLIYVCICLFSLSKTSEAGCPPIFSNLLWFYKMG